MKFLYFIECILFCEHQSQSLNVCSYEFVSDLPDSIALLASDIVFSNSLGSIERCVWPDPLTNLNPDEWPKILRTTFNSLVSTNGKQLVHSDTVAAIERIDDLDSLLGSKARLFSVILDLSGGDTVPDHWGPVMTDLSRASFSDWFVVGQNMTTAQRVSVYRAAFQKFRFSLILDDGVPEVSEALVHAISMHTVPVYNGFFELSTMFANGVAAWNQEQFSLSMLEQRLGELNRQIKFLWSYQQIMQEVLWYRYRSRPEERLHYIASIVCGSQRLPMVFVGIYSAVKNANLRNAVRATWGRELTKLGIEFRFFLSGVADDLEEAEYGDTVFLPVSDGYENNSKKGVLFLDWVATHANQHRFLVKTDDDIFFRPKPLMEYLKSRIPAGYVWGFIDYISPVPRSPESPFYNSPTLYPFKTFPPYARGVVRVVSMDIVYGISKLHRENGLRMIFGDDPSFGVHLRQLGSLVPTITLDDFGSYSRFAMEPTCGKSWSPITNSTWVVHHVNATQIACMWQADQTGTSLCECT